VRKIITDAGLTCPSCHFGFGQFKDEEINESIEFSQQLGINHMMCSTFWLPKTATISDYQFAADELNKAADKIKKAGMDTAFHNHSFEFATLEGQLIYDALMNRFDPDLVKMQFQTEVINLGYKASTYFKKYHATAPSPDRYPKFFWKTSFVRNDYPLCHCSYMYAVFRVVNETVKTLLQSETSMKHCSHIWLRLFHKGLLTMTLQRDSLSNMLRTKN
jgi:hypothetical protein